MTDEMSKAICWELGIDNTDFAVKGLRILLAGTHVGTQILSDENSRPRWSFQTYTSPALAAAAAVRETETFEQAWNAKLAVEPGEIILHPVEVNRISDGKMPPSLRARCFTSLTRRDPRNRGAE